MNIYTVGAATQGLSNYLKMAFAHLPEIKVAIGHDCRNNSRLFSETAAAIFSANGIKVYLFESLRPTPELSFAIRELGLQSGIILTASHNPKEYNGYKAYWDDGSQIVEPHDINIIAEVEKVKVEDIRFTGDANLIFPLGADMDERYLKKVVSISLSPEAVKKQHDLKIVYTPIHGTGVKLVPLALAKMGFTNIIHIPEQDVVSGDFPTVISPNPEEPAALALALKKSERGGCRSCDGYGSRCRSDWNCHKKRQRGIHPGKWQSNGPDLSLLHHHQKERAWFADRKRICCQNHRYL